MSRQKLLPEKFPKAVDNVNDIIAEEIIGMDAFDQVGLDTLMIQLDGTENG